MRGPTTLLGLALLALSLPAQGRQLQGPAPSEAITSGCLPSWTAVMDESLSNSLSSDPTGQGNVTLVVVDEATLYFRAALNEGVRIKSLQLRARDEQRGVTVLDLPLSTQMTNETEGFLSNSHPNFNTLVDMLKSGRTSLAAEVASPHHNLLVGALSSDCEPQTTEIVVSWSSESLPACNVPGFSELYTIPESCHDFSSRVERNCGIPIEDVLVASAHDVDGNLVGYGISRAACLPTWCNPCSQQLRDHSISQVLDDERDLFADYPGPCEQPGFETYHQSHVMCDNLADRLLDACGVRIEDVLQASALSLGFFSDGICLPVGCEPCAAYPTIEVGNDLGDAAPFCSRNYLYTRAFTIPPGCGYLPDRLQEHCGVNAEAVAEASGMESYPFFAGFGEGKTVCLPEICDPCSENLSQLIAQA